MKAILIVDMPIDIDDVVGQAFVTIQEKSGIMRNYPFVDVRPFPMKRQSAVDWLHHDTQTVAVITHEPSDYDKGWNDCIDFLEGEEHD